MWVNLVEGGHYSFFTMCHDLDPALLSLFEPSNVEDGCGPDFTPSTQTVPLLATYLLAFARVHVLEEPRWTAIFEGEPLHPDFEISL